MIFTTVYRASFYLMLLFATLCLNVDASDSKIAWLFPPGVALAGVFAFFTVDRNPRFALARPVAYGLLGVAFMLAAAEYSAEANLVLALAHFLVYLQLVKMLLPKTVEDDWLLFSLGVMQVLVGAVVSQSDREGITMLLWALLALWVLGLFYLRRESLRARALTGTPDDGARGDEPDEPYPGLINPAYVFSALRVMATTLALGGTIFLLMPRRAGSLRAQGVESTAKHLTGFDDEVQLGQLGEILESDSIVMSVEFYNEKDERVTPPDDSLYWRGVTMTQYDDGRWQRSRWTERQTFPTPPQSEQRLRQVIKLEPTDSDVLFGVRPMYSAAPAGRRMAIIELNADDGTIRRDDVGHGTYDYVVVSSPDADEPQPGESLRRALRRSSLQAVPDSIRERLKGIAEEVVAREQIEPDDVLGKARALERYLRDSGQFGYTLHLGVTDPKLDPVVDFLVNRREGHCEYFASALTLLLRSVDVRTRLVNGFKGGDWAALTRVLSVRQKHAHSWVEALIPPRDGEPPRWVRLDATPGNARARSVAEVGGLGSGLRQFSDAVRYIWVFYIVGFNIERQNTMLYQPIRELIREAREGFLLMGNWLRDAVRSLLTFKNPGQFFSRRGFVVSFLALLLFAGVYRCVLWCWRRLLRWLHGGSGDDATLAAGVVFYRRLAALLAEYGLERPAAETPREFARRATAFLTGRGAGTQAVAGVPDLVVDAFYHIRFGHHELAPDTLTRLERSLDALERQLRSGEH